MYDGAMPRSLARRLALTLIAPLALLSACSDPGTEPADQHEPESPSATTDGGAEEGSAVDASPDGAPLGDASPGDASPDGAVLDAGSDASTEPEHSGDATYYRTTKTGACGIPTPPDDLVAALNGKQYAKENCGRCVTVDGPKGSVTVRVIDKCPGCGFGDIDLSDTAFTRIADKSAGRVKVTWRFVPCP